MDLMYNRYLGGITDPIKNIINICRILKKVVYKRTEYIDQEEIDRYTEEIIVSCKYLMKESQRLYAEIEKRFGIDVYND